MVSAHGWLVASVWLLIPPVQALWGLVSLPFSLAALGWLLAHVHRPERLKPALALTVAATLLHGLRRHKQKYGMVTMCIGTGMGAAGVFEAL